MSGAAPLADVVMAALVLDGVDSYMDLGRSEAFLPGVELSLEAWINTTAFGEWTGIVGNVFDTGAIEGGYGLSLTANGGVFFSLTPAGGGIVYLRSGENTLTLNQWHHVAGTYDGSVMRVYVDGVEKNSQSVAAEAIDYDPTSNLFIGLYADDDEVYYFPGAIDEVRIWRRTLSPAEIEANMHRGIRGAREGLVGCWSFNQVDENGRVVDESTNGHHGTLMGQAQLAASDAPVAEPTTGPVAGAPTAALVLDGVDSYMDLGRSDAFLPGVELSLEAWINTTTFGEWTGIVSNIFDSGATEGGYGLTLTGNGGVYFGLTPAGSGMVYLGSGVNTVTLNQWHHVAGTYDGSVMRVYVDGVEKNSQSVAANAIDYDPTSNLFVGLYADDNEAYYFSGAIDEVRIWQRTLSPAEIEANMHRGIRGAREGLVGCWSFNQVDESGRVVDESTNGHHGTLTGTAQLAASDAPVIDPPTAVMGQPVRPGGFALAPNYPNPFNPSTSIRFSLAWDCRVRLAVYNALGQEVARLMDRHLPAGSHQVQWDASDQASGVYLYSLEAGSFTEVRKMMLVR